MVYFLREVKSMSPFGEGIPGAVRALKSPVPSTAVLNNVELERYLKIVLDTLEGKIADRNMLTISKTVAKADRAHETLVEQGLRLLVLQRIMIARNLTVPLHMSIWLRTIKMSAPVTVALRGAA
jgi:hypothetical protein